jgi:hypothetical protein
MAGLPSSTAGTVRRISEKAINHRAGEVTMPIICSTIDIYHIYLRTR